jgi:hypothetical protein
MEIIAIVESDDYGPAAIVDPEHITISKIDNFYIGATRCVFTNMPITCELSEEIALSLIKKGVRCLSLSSEKVILEKEKE